MRIYIAEDDPSVISILEEIIESCGLGEVCGNSGETAADPLYIAGLDPDIVLADFLMPELDGVSLVRELKALGCPARCIMISQVSAKELVGRAYDAGVDFFISKPINLIEVRSVVEAVSRQLESERKLSHIRQMLTAAPQQVRPDDSSRKRKLQLILGQLGISSEKGAEDILKICLYLLEQKMPVTQVSVGQLCEALSPDPKTMEQRVRRAIAKGMANLASMGLEDFTDDTFVRCGPVLFPYEELRAEMDLIRGKRQKGGKGNVKKFIDGMLLLLEEL